ncbi:MAG: hypothetical protein ACRDHZ_13750, partial [Ktedonobacteraceae bacterium]
MLVFGVNKRAFSKAFSVQLGANSCFYENKGLAVFGSVQNSNDPKNAVSGVSRKKFFRKFSVQAVSADFRLLARLETRAASRGFAAGASANSHGWARR